MKLVLAVESIASPLSGIGRYTWELASRVPQYIEPGNLRYYRHARWISDPEPLLHRRPKKPIVGCQRWLRDISMQYECRGQVFHGPNYFLPKCADIGVITVHDLSVFKFPETHPAARVQHFEREFSASLKRTQHIITDSCAMREDIIDYLGWPAHKITAIPLGVSKLFKPMTEAELAPFLTKYSLKKDAYTLCVSTLEPRKKISSMLNSYKHLPPKIREQYPLIIIGGKGWLSEALHLEIETLSRQGWLRYLGFVSEEDLPALYAGARLFIYPSVYEGFGLPPLEAMASGVPVITSHAAVIKEVTQGAALYVEPDDREIFTDTILHALSDEDWYNTAKQNSLMVAQGYSWQTCVEQTVALYRQLWTRYA